MLGIIFWHYAATCINHWISATMQPVHPSLTVWFVWLDFFCIKQFSQNRIVSDLNWIRSPVQICIFVIFKLEQLTEKLELLMEGYTLFTLFFSFFFFVVVVELVWLFTELLFFFLKEQDTYHIFPRLTIFLKLFLRCNCCKSFSKPFWLASCQWLLWKVHLHAKKCVFSLKVNKGLQSTA